MGKVRDVIESCVNLLVLEGYEFVKKILEENFGFFYVIVKVYVKKLENLLLLKVSIGLILLEFVRYFEIVERIFRGMGFEFVSDLNYINILMELNRKLFYFMRGKWVECVGRIIEFGWWLKFIDFLKFVKDRVKFVNNEFGEDFVLSFLREKKRVNERGGRFILKLNVFIIKVEFGWIGN